MNQEIQEAKPWYKTWWGILILVIFLPVSLSVFLINYIWNKTKWNLGAKIGASVAVMVMMVILVLGVSAPSDQVERGVADETAQQVDEIVSDVIDESANLPEVVTETPLGKNANTGENNDPSIETASASEKVESNPTKIPTSAPSESAPTNLAPTPAAAPVPESEPTPASEPEPAPQAGHIFYTSSHYSAKFYYCDTDDGWKSLSPSNLKSFPSSQQLLAAYPNRTLHEPCK